jgi:hypothetical protein
MASRSKKKSAAKPRKTASKKSPTAKKKAASPKKRSGKVELAAARPPASSAEERFKRDVLIRGEAALPDENGNLPSGATHEIIESGEDGGLPEITRRRYKIF